MYGLDLAANKFFDADVTVEHEGAVAKVTLAPFALGTAPRLDGSCRQPGIVNANWSLFKEFSLAKLREGARIELRLEAYNAFNHVVFAAPNATLNSGNFGVITAQANSPRQVQGALKVYW